jgi:small subunit ribosomal protein S17
MTGAITKVQGKRKTKVGRVVSDRMDKTIVVSVERLARHRLYKRVIRLTTKFKAHDETNDARIGDTVLIEESRPISATKRWRLVSVIQRAGEHGLPGEAVVGEEAAVTEAIHAAAHPGRSKTSDEGDAAGGSEPAGGAEGLAGVADLSEDGSDAAASRPSEEAAS